MNNIMDRYRVVKENLNELKVPTKNILLLGLVSFLLAALIVAGPIALIINCTIFLDYQFLITLGLGVCLFLLIYLSRIFYFIGLAKGQVEDMKAIYIVEALFTLLITLVCVIVLF